MGNAQFEVFVGRRKETSRRERQNKHLIDLFGSAGASGEAIEIIDVAGYGNKRSRLEGRSHGSTQKRAAENLPLME